MCDSLALVLLVLMLVHNDNAMADEQPSLSIAPLKPDFNANHGAAADAVPTSPMFDLPQTYQLTGVPAIDACSPGEFRPRGRSILDSEAPVTTSEQAPMLNGTTVWQRLADYRSHGRVRLLTLWETGGSSVSLQAGKKGAPSLQWTSRSMNHGGATRGVFDQLASLSIAGASRGLHPAPRQTSSTSASANPNEPSGRFGKVSEVAIAGANK